MTDDMKVEPKDELRVLEDDREVRASTVGLQERRYLHEVPAEDRRGLPDGAWQDGSCWEVVAFFDPRTPTNKPVDRDDGDSG